MKQSDYQRKFDAALTEMDNAGIWRSKAVPPYLKLAQRMEVEARPPYYEPASKVAVWMGMFAGITYRIAMHLLIWRSHVPLLLLVQFIASIVAGLLFGLTMASWYRHVRRKHGLSSWDDL